MTTWNPSDKHANITLQNSDLRARRGAAGGYTYANVRSTTGKSGTGKFVIKIAHVSSAYGDDGTNGFGVANSSQTLGGSGTNYLGQTANSHGIFPGYTGLVYNDSDPDTVPAWSAGPWWVAIDIDATNVTYRLSTDGTTWSSSFTATKPTGTLYWACCLYYPDGNGGSGSYFDVDFAPTGWTLATYQNWDASGTAYDTTITASAVPITGGSVGPDYKPAITASSVPIGGGTVSPFRGYATAITASSVPITGGTVTPALTTGYSTTITPSAVPITGGTVAPITAYSTAITASSVPISGGTVTPVHTAISGYFGHRYFGARYFGERYFGGRAETTTGTAYDTTITASSLPIVGGTVAPFRGYQAVITASSVPITGGTVTPVHVLHTAVAITASSIPITGGTVTPVSAGPTHYTVDITPASLSIEGGTVDPDYDRFFLQYGEWVKVEQQTDVWTKIVQGSGGWTVVSKGDDVWTERLTIHPT